MVLQLITKIRKWFGCKHKIELIFTKNYGRHDIRYRTSRNNYQYCAAGILQSPYRKVTYYGLGGKYRTRLGKYA